MSSPGRARSISMPPIRRGDVDALVSHLRYEIDVLHERDPHMASYLAQDEMTLLEQYHQLRRASSASEAGAAQPNSMPSSIGLSESQFGPERTQRRSTMSHGSEPGAMGGLSGFSRVSTGAHHEYPGNARSFPHYVRRHAPQSAVSPPRQARQPPSAPLVSRRRSDILDRAEYGERDTYIHPHDARLAMHGIVRMQLPISLPLSRSNCPDTRIFSSALLHPPFSAASASA